ncbi:hypothetical protein C5S39_04435 [Candidatus Methanophagaceae archaeon]|nr:hypothetical protein C5S39_04435 [Methanophagales archaeon]
MGDDEFVFCWWFVEGAKGIVIGGMGGTIAGLTIWLVQLLKEKVTERADKKRVYNWLY